MNIGFVVGGYFEKELTGIGKLSVGMIEEIMKNDDQHQYFITRKIYHNEKLNYSNILSFSPDDQSEKAETLDLFAYMNKLDIIHTFYPTINGMNYPCRKCLMIHDLIPLLHPEWCMPPERHYNFFNTELRRSAKEADVIFTNSAYSKGEIIEHYGISEEKVFITYPGLSHQLKYGEIFAEEKEYCESLGEYLLSVSTVDPRKNFAGLIKAYAAYRDRHPQSAIKLVIVGRAITGSALLKGISEYRKYQDDIIFTGYCSDERLSHLYMYATGVAYVSFYEGFGLPVLEALAAGKAVICSNVTSLPEVGGEAVEYCDPYEIESIINAMENILLNEKRRKELESRSILQATKFSYHKAALETIRIYNKLG
jgi:glycosyltransferase involved in cell wall biosynthesis